MNKKMIGYICLDNVRYPIYQLYGDGFCSCHICEKSHGWSRIWTSSCYMINDTVICYKCFNDFTSLFK